jgi:outer membrane biosynthesis protein TonB
MRTPPTKDRLRVYEHTAEADSSAEPLFRIILLLCLSLSMAMGLYFKKIKPAPETIEQEIGRFKTRFVISQPVKKAPPVKKKTVVEKKVPVEQVKPAPATNEKPIDLTQNPVLGQKTDDIHPTTGQKPVRRVYGLRRVYSTGLGAGGSLSDAVVGKLGNTLAKEVDTLAASKAEIKGEIASVTTVTSMPRILKTVKPEYTPEMIKNGIEGVIRIKILIDIDGKVKKAQALNDLGFGAAERALDACYAMLFEPARRGEAPVATEIIVSIRFVLSG